jgi:hypothetical protein
MSALLLLFLQAGLKIAKRHTGEAGDEVIDAGDFIIDVVRDLDRLYEEEVGQPIDWTRIRTHEHLPPAGGEPEAPTDPGPIE